MSTSAKARRKLREQKIAMEGWYSCMEAMGRVPQDEDYYFGQRKKFMSKIRLTQQKLDRIKLKITN